VGRKSTEGLRTGLGDVSGSSVQHYGLDIPVEYLNWTQLPRLVQTGMTAGMHDTSACAHELGHTRTPTCTRMDGWTQNRNIHANRCNAEWRVTQAELPAGHYHLVQLLLGGDDGRLAFFQNVLQATPQWSGGR
jgi:hypothetical protein